MLLLKHKKITGLFVVFAVTYILQVLLLAPNKATQARYHVSSNAAHIMALGVILPYIIIWFIALSSYLRLSTYAKHIDGSKDGEAFKTISVGVLLLTLWLPVNTLVSGFSSQYYTGHADSTANLIRFGNYSTLALLFPAFVILYRGSIKLSSLVRNPTLPAYQWTILAYIAFAATYTFLTLHDAARNHPIAGVQTSSYYEPDWLILTTLIIPRLIMWFLGFMAVQNIYLYRQRVKGLLYKRALKTFAAGLATVIVSYILLRCLQSLSVWLSELNLPLLLTVIYILLLFIGVGYVILNRGTKSLLKIEGS